MKKERRIDLGSLIVMAVTLVLFVAAVFTKGLTHDLLLEAGVFLVSVKLILLGFRNNVSAEALRRELAEIRAMLAARGEDERGGRGPGAPPTGAPPTGEETKGRG